MLVDPPNTTAHYPLPTMISTPAQLGYRMPAEWEPHEATWIAWPHNRDGSSSRNAPVSQSPKPAPNFLASCRFLSGIGGVDYTYGGCDESTFD